MKFTCLRRKVTCEFCQQEFTGESMEVSAMEIDGKVWGYQKVYENVYVGDYVF